MRYENLELDEERALYGEENVEIKKCVFDGPADGESALKECKNIMVEDCDFRLRYPFWHVNMAKIVNSRMTEGCRAALWYDRNIKIISCKMDGIKAFRECDTIDMEDCQINSTEFAWKCNNIFINDCTLHSEYPFFESRNMNILNLKMTGKYSFQYVEDVVIKDSYLDTKDAFWHSKNVTVMDSTVKGEYLGWYAKNLKFVRCRIIGTQPLCYVDHLVLEDCIMEETDLAFEYSTVEADIKGSIVSVKNPMSGFIKAESIGEIILEHSVKGKSHCEIIIG